MPSFFGASAPVPADGGSNATTTITLTPPASMLAGDLAVVYTTQRGNAAWSVGLDGGQTWDTLGDSTTTANVSLNTFYTVFDGAWTVDPRFDCTAGTNTTAIMLVFRPTVLFGGWDFEQFTSVAQAAAATITVTDVTPVSDNNVTIASWHSADDNTWGNLSGTNWTKGTLAAQYRNLAGQDSSSTFAYQTQTTAAPTNNVSQQQLTLGNDATQWRRVTFYEIDIIEASLDPMGMMGIFGI